MGKGDRTPVTEQQKIGVFLERPLHRKVKKEAEKQGVSMTVLIADLLAQRFRQAKA